MNLFRKTLNSNRSYFFFLISYSVTGALHKFLDGEYFNANFPNNNIDQQNQANHKIVDSGLYGASYDSTIAFTHQNQSVPVRCLPSMDQNQTFGQFTACPQRSNLQSTDVNSRRDVLHQNNGSMPQQGDLIIIQNTEEQLPCISQVFSAWKNSTAVTSNNANDRDVANQNGINATNENHALASHQQITSRRMNSSIFNQESPISQQKIENGEGIEQHSQNIKVSTNDDDSLFIMADGLKLAFINADSHFDDHQSKPVVSGEINTESNPPETQNNRMVRISTNCEQQLEVDGEPVPAMQEFANTQSPAIIDLLSDHEEEAKQRKDNVTKVVENVDDQLQPMIQRQKRKNAGVSATENLKKKPKKVRIRVRSVERPYECKICEKRYTMMTNLRRHMKSHKENASNNI